MCIRDRCDPIRGTRETKMKPYAGKPNATKPYHTSKWKEPKTISMGCDNASCDYAVTARVALHNPTKNEYTVEVSCKYFLGEDYTAAKNKRKTQKITGHGTKYVELQAIVGAPPGTPDTIGHTCEARWIPYLSLIHI